MADGGSITLRLSLKGADEVRAELAKTGPAGAAMAREIDRAMRQPNAGLKALDTGAREARSSIDGLASRAGPAGAVLSSLGVAGTAVAAGVAAAVAGITVALGKAAEAARFADELEDAAAKINIGVEALQAWRFAAEEAGATATDADTAIEAFQKKLGEGIAGGRSVKWFERIGFDREDLKAFGSTEEALQAVINKIAGLSSEAERAAVADKLGLSPLIPLIRQGSGAIEEMMERARDLGLVMDQEMVTRGAQSSREMEVLSQVIDLQLKQAFIDLGPAIIEILKLVASLATAIAGLMDDFRRMEDRSTRGLQTQAARLRAQNEQLMRQYGSVEAMSGRAGTAAGPAGSSGGAAGPGGALMAQAMGPDVRRTYEENIRQYNDIQRQLNQRADNSTTTVTGGDTHLVDLGGGGGGVDKEAQEAARKRREAERALERLDREGLDVQRDWFKAVIAGKDTAEGRAEAARAMLSLDQQEEAAELNKMRASIEAGGLMTEEVKARLDKIEILRQDVAHAREAQIEEQRVREQREAMRAAEQAHAEVTSEILSIASANARTSDERRTIELQLLGLAQRRQRADLEAAIQAEKEPAARARLVELLDRLPKLFDAQTAEVNLQTAGPVAKWWDDQKSEGQAQEWLQGEALDALDGLNKGLIETIRSAQNAGDAFSAMGEVAVGALGKVADALLEIALQRLLIQPLASALFGDSSGSGGLLSGLLNGAVGAMFGGGLSPKAAGGSVTVTGGKGFAGGGVAGATGLYPVGERGIELTELPAGSRVYDTDRSERILRDAMRAGSAPTQVMAPTINMPVKVINTGSEQMTATTRQTPDGIEVILAPLIRGEVNRMGADGGLARAGRLQRPPKRR